MGNEERRATFDTEPICEWQDAGFGGAGCEQQASSTSEVCDPGERPGWTARMLEFQIPTQ